MNRKFSMIPNSKINGEVFLSLRLTLTLVTFVSLLFITEIGYIYAPLGAILVYYLVTHICLLKPLKLRVEKLDFEALDFFEVLTLSLESGKNLEQALEVTTNVVKSELSEEFRKALYEINIDAIIVQDMGILEAAINKELPPIPIHMSTQCNNRTVEKVKFFEEMGLPRVILARELSLKQIKEITDMAIKKIKPPIVGVPFFALCEST